MPIMRKMNSLTCISGHISKWDHLFFSVLFCFVFVCLFFVR